MTVSRVARAGTRVSILICALALVAEQLNEADSDLLVTGCRTWRPKGFFPVNSWMGWLMQVAARTPPSARQPVYVKGPMGNAPSDEAAVIRRVQEAQRESRRRRRGADVPWRRSGLGGCCARCLPSRDGMK